MCVWLVPGSCEEGAVRQFSYAPSRSLVVLMCLNGSYTTVCGQSWGDKEAAVVCNQLGYSSRGNRLYIMLMTLFILHYYGNRCSRSSDQWMVVLKL